MANTYEQILTLANKNNMGLSNTIMRDYGIPLDYSSVQATYEAALEYAKNSTLAYMGQPISVGDILYIITDAAHGYLKAVGTKPSGDNSSIIVDEDGKISIKGFTAAPTTTLPRKGIDGSIEWVTIDAIVANDSNTKTVLAAAENSSITIIPTYDGTTDTYTYVLDVELPPPQELPHVPEYTLTKEVNDKQITYNLSKDGTQVGETIVVPNAYNDTDLSNRVGTLEKLKHIDDIIYDSSSKKIYLVAEGTQIGEGFDASSFVKDGMIESVSLVDNKLVITWNSDVDSDEDSEKDVTEISLTDLIDIYEAGTGVTVEGKLISIDKSVVATVEALNQVKVTAAAAQTAEQVTTAITSALEPYATNEALKATDDIAKDSQNRVGIVEGKIRDITSVGGEPNVLEIIKVNGVTQPVADRAVDITIPTKISDLDGSSEFDGQFLELGDQISAIQDSITEHSTDISNLESKDIELAQAVQENTERFASYLTAEQVGAKIKEEVSAIDLSEFIDEDFVRTITDPLTSRISTIEGEGEGSIKKAIVESEAYTDIEVAKDRNRISDLEAANNEQNTLISNNTTAIAQESSDRASEIQNLSSEISEKLGDSYSSENTVAKAIEAAKKAGTDAATAVSSLTNGQVKTNATDILNLSTSLNSEIDNRKAAISQVEDYIDESVGNTNESLAKIENRLVEVEAFFIGADKDGEGLENALDKLVEIQEFLSEEGSAVDQLLGTTATNTADITVLKATVGDKDSGLVKKAADLAATTSTLGTDVETLKSITAGYNSTDIIKADVAEAKDAAADLKAVVVDGDNSNAKLRSAITNLQSITSDSDKGNDKLRADLNNLTSVVNHSDSGLVKTKETADDALSKANTNSGAIAEIETNYLRFAGDNLFAGKDGIDIIIFDCGSALEEIE